MTKKVSPSGEDLMDVLVEICVDVIRIIYWNMLSNLLSSIFTSV